LLLLPASGATEGAYAGSAISLLPPVFAISLAFATGRTLLPLVGGVWAGAVMLAWHDGAGLLAPLRAVLDVLWVWVFQASVYDLESGWQEFSLSVVGFVFVLVGMVAVAVRAGGMAGVAERFATLAQSPRATRLTTWALGLSIFFDDYANTVIVGGTMRPLADRMKISREKLAWIVDSTAAPVAGISILSTWVAFEVSNFAPQLGAVGLSPDAGYVVFLESVPYRFYCLLTLAYVGIAAWSGRDFGPMLAAERRADRTGAVFNPGARPMSGVGSIESEAAPGIPHRAHLALVPVTLTLLTVVGLFLHGGLQASVGVEGGFLARARVALGGVDNNTTLLLYAALVGLTSAALLAVGERLLSVGETVRAAVSGWRVMGMAVSILLMAWAMSGVCDALGTRAYLAAMAPHIPPLALPAGLFLLACVVSFSTGSSWATMGILLPNVVALAAQVGEDAAIGPHAMVVLAIASVLDGSIFGDHCSPLSDTTILSSTAAGSDHMDHVRTQAPYALTVMAAAVVLGYLPVTMGMPVWAGLLLGLSALVAVQVLVAKPIWRRPSI